MKDFKTRGWTKELYFNPGINPVPAVPIPTHSPIPPPNVPTFQLHPPYVNQYQFQTNIPSSFNFSNTLTLPQPPLLPPGGQALGLGTLGSESPWLMANQAQLGLEMMRRQEAVNAQTVHTSYEVEPSVKKARVGVGDSKKDDTEENYDSDSENYGTIL